MAESPFKLPFKTAAKQINLSQLSWITSGRGKLYVPYESAITIAEDVNEILDVTIAGWDNFTSGFIVQPYISRGDKVSFMSNDTSSIISGTLITIKVLYR